VAIEIGSLYIYYKRYIGEEEEEEEDNVVTVGCSSSCEIIIEIINAWWMYFNHTHTLSHRGSYQFTNEYY
jgi:hypothetical protein